MNKELSLGLLIGGIVLAAFGINASQSLASEISRFFTGNPTEKAIWMLVGGAAMFVVGLAGLLRGSNKTR